ncbi:nucleotide disphospho-sugar-binding domain-containing protein [Petropleomorpha daqingensis]|uniref:UDP:flavonoid glycosyltransferase YjiC (YdhE family) n=1 Tax=Petropleomorpha daqingensis TaxID=2026353 RepID=A0A853CNC4_9ACTN|nr:nucleotide disphospho-sugar-binding domain-containing protein [Petropleomorpha daqingensis]NYJ07493.1 UDP:flavonoid glycosyltransferase YjiC (YdhE family) [Petropleomorpha daqingensis]
MRVLVVAAPLTGHLLPLVPIARALRDAGHEVVVGTAGEALGVCPPDLTTADVAPRLRMMPLFLRFLARHPRLSREAMAGRDEIRTGALLWAPVNHRMAGGLRDLADRFRPDLVLHEPLAGAASGVARYRSIPSVLVDALLVDTPALFAAVLAAYQPGLPAPTEILSSVPPSLVGGARGRPMRFIGFAPDRPFDETYARPGERPRVLVSRSTVDDPFRDRLMSTVADAAGGTDLDVVLVRPDRWVTRRQLPPNVATTGWLPFPQVLPAAAGIVHHGGAGTLLTALAAGVPQLVLRGSGDRRVNADVLAARGAGLAADLSDLSPALLERLVSDAALTAAAREVAAEMAAMPHPTEVVPVLEQLAARVPGR